MLLNDCTPVASAGVACECEWPNVILGGQWSADLTNFQRSIGQRCENVSIMYALDGRTGATASSSGVDLL